MRCLYLPMALALAALLGCGAGSGGGGGASTPEAILEKAEAARKAEDWQTYIDCHTPDTHVAMVRQNLETALSL